MGLDLIPQEYPEKQRCCLGKGPRVEKKEWQKGLGVHTLHKLVVFSNPKLFHCLLRLIFILLKVMCIHLCSGRKWWRFAIHAHLNQIHERNRRLTWNFLTHRAHQLVVYSRLYADHHMGLLLSPQQQVSGLCLNTDHLSGISMWLWQKVSGLCLKPLHWLPLWAQQWVSGLGL